MKYIAFAAAIAAVAAVPQLGAKQEQKSNVYTSGDRACMVGDSITEDGWYEQNIMLYYATRFPEMQVDFRNIGISGDICLRILNRMESDVLPQLDKSKSVTVLMIGMNDVDMYKFAPETRAKIGETELRRRIADSRSVYERRLGQVVDFLAPNSRRLILFTPSIYDQTAELPKVNYAGTNDELEVYGKIGAKIAAKIPNASVVDMQTKMKVVNAELQSKEGKTKTIISPDRVHPRFAGGFVMLNAWLERFGEPREVSTVEIDAAAKKLGKSFNCDISNLSFSGGAIAFDSLAAALPFPVEKAARNLDGYMKFAQNFNREILKISGLQNGEYALEIDGEKVGAYSAKQLADGVNLATNTNTPQYKQAEGVHNLCGKFRAETVWFRKMRGLEFANAAKMDKLDVDGKIAFIKSLLETNTKAPSYVKKSYKYYIENRKRADEKFAEIGKIAEDAYRAATPKTRSYKIEKIK